MMDNNEEVSTEVSNHDAGKDNEKFQQAQEERDAHQHLKEVCDRNGISPERRGRNKHRGKEKWKESKKGNNKSIPPDLHIERSIDNETKEDMDRQNTESNTKESETISNQGNNIEEQEVSQNKNTEDSHQQKSDCSNSKGGKSRNKKKAKETKPARKTLHLLPEKIWKSNFSYLRLIHTYTDPEDILPIVPFDNKGTRNRYSSGVHRAGSFKPENSIVEVPCSTN
ncbi:hypothetical protein RND71_025929 [Anisodus tanguticus]|uniref:Uncharacterized protein n=1 Tax=Anisodus tanguticus TaxID=243964 RepID=A0AAE1RJZ8_9SOLA|nr:hypothetical protein RND71_025929 [Anisodus tanguticus]